VVRRLERRGIGNRGPHDYGERGRVRGGTNTGTEADRSAEKRVPHVSGFASAEAAEESFPARPRVRVPSHVQTVYGRRTKGVQLGGQVRTRDSRRRSVARLLTRARRAFASKVCRTNRADGYWTYTPTCRACS